MNILILNWRDVSHPLSGGAEIVTMKHAQYWVKKGHQVTWFTSWYPGVKHEETIGGVRMVRRLGSLTVYPAAVWYVLTRGRDYDVIVDEVHGFPFFSPLFTRTPVVVFIHEVAGEIWDFMYPFPINIIGKFVEQWYFSLYKHCLFWTDAQSMIEELLSHGIPRNQCIAIPCPIALDKRLMTKDKKNHISFIFDHISKEKYPTYLFVSRVVKMKGIEEVIKAFSFIVKEQKDAKLWIVGGGEVHYIKELKAMISDYGVSSNVIFFGKVTEQKKYELMAKSHLLLHASVKEGWGLVVLEAASVGTPSVVYDVPGLRDVVKHQRTGIVLKTNSPQEMALESMKLINEGKRYRDYQEYGKLWSKSLQWNDVTQKSLHILQTSTRTKKQKSI